MNFLCSFSERLHHFLLNLARLNLNDMIICFRHGQVQHIRRLNIRNLLEHGDQLGNIVESRKTCLCSVSRTLGSKLNRRYRLPISRSPRIKMKQVVIVKHVMLQVFLHRIKLNHRVGDRRSRCKNGSLILCDLIKISALHIKIGGFLRFCLRNARHVSHF